MKIVKWEKGKGRNVREVVSEDGVGSRAVEREG